MSIDVNYIIITAVILALLIILILFLRRNHKDKKELTEDLENTDVEIGLDQKY